jgi:hypothetical protein
LLKFIHFTDGKEKMMLKWAVFGIATLMVIVVGGVIVQMSNASAQTALKADAGPDQTVFGTNPVLVAFQGTANAADYVCRWLNQWNRLRADDICAPAPQQHHFSGQVYVDGALAPAGGIIIADLGGSTVGQATVGDNGQYSIDLWPRGGVKIIEWLYSADGQECCLVSTTASTFTAGDTDTLDLPFFTLLADPAEGHTIPNANAIVVHVIPLGAVPSGPLDSLWVDRDMVSPPEKYQLYRDEGILGPNTKSP